MRIHRLEGAWVPLLLLAVACICNGQYYNVITQSCGEDDFHCDDGKCIESRHRCDKVADCLNEEDEKNCTCNFNEFRCVSDGSCIEIRRKCDGVSHCSDHSDEQNCASGYFKCRTGKLIPENLRCNRHYDCPPGDYSDEKNCPCGEGDFKCDNGYCIPASKHCDRTHDCQDGSDERHCTYGTVCMAYQYKCSNGQCVPAESWCNGTKECDDGTDETNCPCKRDQFQCRDGSCINLVLRCNGHRDCSNGDDEHNCGEPQCPADSFKCNAGSAVACAKMCDGQPECSGGEDEDDCNECSHFCDSRCLEDSLICDGNTDCSDGSDELNCYQCDGRDDFKCQNDECINANLRCNGEQDCSDYSDELYCNSTIIPSSHGCADNEFQCKDGSCVNSQFICDGQQDCNDNSDELNCQCSNADFQCTAGGCIPSSGYCDGNKDCPDGSDENNCTNNWFTTESSYRPPATNIPAYSTTQGNGRYDPLYNHPDRENAPDRDPYDSTERPLSRDPYGTSQRPPNRDPYGTSENPPSRDPYASEENQPGRDLYGSSGNAPGRDPYGPSGNAPGRDPYGPSGNVPGRDPYGLSGNDPNRDQYGSSANDPNRDQYGQSGNDPGSDQYGSSGNDPNSDQYGESGNTPGGDPYGAAGNAPDREPNGSSGNVPNRGPYGLPDNNPDGDRYGPSGNSPSGDPYGSSGNDAGRYPNQPSGNVPGREQYGSTENDINAYGTEAPGSSENDINGDNGYQYGQRADETKTGTGGSRGESPYGSASGGRDYNGPIALKVKTYPQEQSIRYAQFGGDVVFQCRDEGPQRAAVRWVREGGRPLKPGTTDRHGRLEMYQVSVSDSGVYICQTPAYLSYPGSEVRVTLNVESPRVTQRPNPICKPHEATCGNGQCIPKSAVCNGRFDCDDKSDEDTCSSICEPNEYQCANHKCVLKTWLCDADDDCGDGSDEQDCGPVDAGHPCLPSEFACRGNNQCVPKSFHCDTQTDCFDGSDEIGCAPIHVTVPPRPSNLKLNPGDTLTLSCEAVGMPVPLISWRLNWGHVPSKCYSTSVNGVGLLTCPNMQPVDSGAYSCEAINNKGTTFASPDAIVYVNKTVCPNGYFNSEARSPSECIRCFCFGESNQCDSADLFTYNMPTPLGEGGTRMLEVKITNSGDVEIGDSGSNDDQYYYQALKNGASVTKLTKYETNWGRSNTHPYVTLPETYNGNQLTSYGGRIKYVLEPHSIHYNGENSIPSIIIKGKYERLIHVFRKNDGKHFEVEARLTPEHWQKATPSGLVPATREDIMMALDNIQQILLRADLNGFGVNITDFVMESAHHINVGLGAASLVEECKCPPGYEGLSCEKCTSGYTRESAGPWLGRCVRPTCPPGTYGDPSSGYACKPCPCPLTNRENQFSRTCSLASDGQVVCDCFPGYEGKKCEYCTPGYVGNPLLPGDSCKPVATDNCNKVGTSQVRLPDDCVCKDNVQGRYCDQCKNDSFYLSNDFRHGCALCFCSGVSQQCMSSNLRRQITTVQFNVPSIVDQVRVYNSAPSGPAGAVRYNAPIDTGLKPELVRGQILLRDIDRSRPSIYYWSLPSSFAGDKVTSYGGYLRYTLVNTPTRGSNPTTNAADVQLISENHLTFHYTGDFTPSNDGTLNASVQFLERGWRRSDGKEVSREHFLLALADVKTILIKATYDLSGQLAIPVLANIETAEPRGNGPSALHVEQCVCPIGYVGTSCEDCAPGYTRSASGLYLEHCGLCECNGHSKMCHPETGICSACADNTAGSHCEECKPGYEPDGNGNCVEYRTSTYQPCRCDSRGEATPCDSSGRCNCKQNAEGESCDVCRPGTFGLSADNPLGCISCYCSGVTNECNEGSHYTRIPMAAPIFGDNYGGYTLMDLNAEEVINDHFIPVPDKSELMYIFPFPARTELFWSLPVFPGNRVLSYGGALSLKQEFEGNDYSAVSEPGTDIVLVGDDTSLYWTNPNVLRSKEPTYYQVPLNENGWFTLNTNLPASRNSFMGVLKNLRRVLVRATVTSNILSTAIADVSMDTATESYDPDSPAAKGVEICMCPNGYTGTSCETCSSGYYKDQHYCRQCSCNGHDCQLDTYGQVVCNCRPPYTGPDCTTIGDREPHPITSPRPPPPTTTVTVQITGRKFIIREVGSSVNFTCKAQSRLTSSPLPISWFKVDGALPRDRTLIDSGVLFITNLQPSDSGSYACQTNDGVSTERDVATLKVPGNDMTEPVVSIRPIINEYFEGDRVELECTVSGNPTPTITWQRASRRPLPVSVETVDGVFIIESALEEDSGEYRCIGSNPLGSVDRTAVITIRPRPSWPTREKLTVQPTAASVAEGQNTRVVCTGTPKVPAGSIEWNRQDGDEFLTNVRSENGVLYIDYARMENQGIYVCQTSSVGVANVPILVTVIAMSTPPPSENPNITVSVDHLRIPTGNTGTVDCNPHGSQLPLIKWSKHSGNFGPGTSQRGHTLIISNAQDEDQGYYLCEGSVRGTVVANAYVLVEIEKREPPRVEIWPQGEQAVALGTQYELHCRVLGGIPEPDVMWDRAGGRPLSSTTHIQPHNILKFERIEVNDEGEYTCSATSVAGTASASSVLKVRSQPEITFRPGTFLQPVRGDPVTVECRASGYPEPLVSIKSNTDLRELVPPTPSIAVLRIPSVSDRDDDDYTCTATNAAGTIQDQFAIRVNRGDGGIGVEEGSGEESIGVSEMPYNPDEQPRSLEGYEGQSEIVIYCTGSDEYQPRWDRYDRQPLQRNAIQDGPRLIIRNVSKSDSGQYVCSLLNVYTGEISKAAYTSLSIISAPRITLNPKTQTVQPGQSPTVECVVEGDDILDVSWRPVDRSPSSRVETRSSRLIFHQIEVEDAGKYECFARNRLANASAIAEVIVSGAREVLPALVAIDQPRRRYRIGENVEVLCKANNRNTNVKWERLNTNQYVESRTYGDGSMLLIQGVQDTDAAVYRCIGMDRNGRTTYDDFNLEVEPGTVGPAYPDDRDVPVAEYSARLKSSIDLPCNHNLEQPVSIEWRKEFTSLPSEVRAQQPILHLERVTEKDAGTYVCRVSNNRAVIEAKAILRVVGIVPRFNGEGSWLSLPTLKDVYRQFDIEVSFRPADGNGLILYNSENQGRNGDYLALWLEDGVPQFILDTGTGPVIVKGDRPLQLNIWHTIRVSRTNTKVTMDVDNIGPFTAESSELWAILDLSQPLYIGGVPDYNQLPAQLAGTSGFVGCVSLLILGRIEKNIMVDSIDQYQVDECISCAPNSCLNNGVCQEAPNERGFKCICAAGYAGLNCDRIGEACREGLCGPGKCIDAVDGYKCACPVTHNGRNCEQKQFIEYPAFTGSTFLAINQPASLRYMKMSMKVKATSPVTDGIIMYCAESSRGYGGFTALIVRDGRLEFRYDPGEGSTPVILTSNRTLPANDWTNVHIARFANTVSMKINLMENYEQKLDGNNKGLKFEIPMFVGGIDDSVVLNNNTGVTGGFSGCIKDVMIYGKAVDIVNSSIQSANVQECINYDRGDIPEIESVCSQCRNGGECYPDSNVCSCPAGFAGTYCEQRAGPPPPRQIPINPCAAHPCLNGGSCKPNQTMRMNYTCDCPLGYAGAICQMPLELLQSVGFNGNGYVELPSQLLRYDNLNREPAVIALAIHTNNDGVLLYQRESLAPPNYGDYILLRIENGYVVLEWNLGSDTLTITVDTVYVSDGERHQIIVKLFEDNHATLSVDGSRKTGEATGISNLMNADSNIYIGGIPDNLNVHGYPGLSGCVEQVELMDHNRGLRLGKVAVSGRNTQRCRESNRV